MDAPIIPGFPADAIPRDAQGRASLTIMWQLTGGNKRNKPHEWLRTQKAKKSIFRFTAEGLPEPVIRRRGAKSGAGDKGHTWALPQIARDYLCHLAPRFHVWHQHPELLDKFSAPEFWPDWKRSTP